MGKITHFDNSSFILQNHSDIPRSKCAIDLDRQTNQKKPIVYCQFHMKISKTIQMLFIYQLVGKYLSVDKVVLFLDLETFFNQPEKYLVVFFLANRF